MKRIVNIIVAAVILALSIASVVQFLRVRALRAEVDSHKATEQMLTDAVARLNVENEKIRDMVRRATDALSVVVERLEKAGSEHVERVAQIDSADHDWLVCPIPDEVREALGYHGDAGNKATGDVACSVREAESVEARD